MRDITQHNGEAAVNIPLETNAPNIGALNTIEAAARFLCLHAESVRRCIRQKRIKALKFGHCWRIPGEELLRIAREGLPVE